MYLVRASSALFSLDSLAGEVSLPEKLEIPEGDYADLIDGGTVSVRDGKLFCPGRPLIFAL